MKKYILSIILFVAALFAGLPVFGQEGSGNWTGTQTNRQSYLWVPNMSTGGTGNPGYDHRGFMMLPSNGTYNSSNPYDPGHRLYVYVKQGETVYWGFRRASGSNRTAQWYYDNRSHDGTDTGSLGLFPSGISGQGRLTIGSSATISTTSGPDQTQSTRGPNIAGVRTNGYNANSFTNNTGQDRAFWIELNSNSSGNQISFWDVSVYDGTTHKPGRVYSKYWSVYNGLPGSGGGANNTTSGSGNNTQITTARSNTTSFHDNFGFYVPVENTNDDAKDGYYIKQILFPGANTGYGVFFANEDGPRNDLSFEENRRSMVGTSSNYQFPLFVTQPDPSVWEIADEPFVQVVPEFSRRTAAEEGLYGGPGGKAVFTVTVDNPGFVDILIDLDKNGVFSEGDVIISRELTYDEVQGGKQTFIIVWDGNRENGLPVPSGAEVRFVSMTTFFPVHFPIYDMEQSLGMIVNHIAPNPTQQEQVMFWDHSALQSINATPPTNSRQFGNLGNTPINQNNVVHVNVTGMSGKANQWWAHGNYGIGDERTMNLWAGGAAETLEEDYTFNWDSSDLGIEKSVDNDSPYVGDIATFTIKVYNHGLQDAEDVVVVDQLPAGLTYVSHDNNGIGSVVVDNATNKVTWTIASMPYQTPVLENGYTLIIRALVENSGPYTNGVTVTSPNDPNPDNNDSEVPLTPIDCAAGADQVFLLKSGLSNSEDVVPIGSLLFFEDFGTSDYNNGHFGRVESSYMPAGSFEFGDSYNNLPTPGGNPWDDNPIRNAARINDGFYAVVAPGYIDKGWFADDGWASWWTPAFDQPSTVTDYSGKTDGAALVINAGNNTNAFYNRQATIEVGATFKASFQMYLVQKPGKVAIDVFELDGTTLITTFDSGELDESHEGKWNLMEIEFTIPGEVEDCGSSKEVIISLRNGKAEISGNDWYIDNIMVEKLSDAPLCPVCVLHDIDYVNLNDAIDALKVPAGADVKWFKDAEGTVEVEHPDHVTESGTYYAFYYDEANECYNTTHSSSTVTVTIYDKCPIVANDDFNQTNQNVPVLGNVLNNDTGANIKVQDATYLDEHGNKQTVAVESTGTTIIVYDKDAKLAGELVISEDGEYTFTPADGYTGRVPVEYTLADDLGQEDSATLTIDVLPPYDPLKNNPPIAIDDYAFTEKGKDVSGNMLTNDSDPDGDEITVTQIIVPGHNDPIDVGTGVTDIEVKDENGDVVGKITVNPNGSFTFTPSDDFVGDVPPIEYTVCDNGVPVECADAILNIVVKDEGDSKIITNDDINSAQQGVTMDGSLKDNDDWGDSALNPVITQAVVTVDGKPVTFDINTTGAQSLTVDGKTIGTLELNPETGAYEFIPEPEYTGTVQVVYTVTNDAGDTDTSTLTLTSVPIKPVAKDDINQTPQGVAVDGNVLDNDIVTNGPLTVESATYMDGSGNMVELTVGDETLVYGHDKDGDRVPAGKITLKSDGTYTFEPNANFTGTVPVDYVAVDKKGFTDDATLTIKVIPVVDPSKNNPPVAIDDNVVTKKNTSVDGNLLSNDSDPDGDTITVTKIEVPAQGGGTTPVTIPQDGTTPPTTPVYDGNTKIGDITVDKDGNFTFKPVDGYAGGVPPIGYEISDNSTLGALTDKANLNIIVVQDVIGDIIANDDANSAPKGITMTGNVKDNDDWGDEDKNPKVTEATITFGDDAPVVLTIGTPKAIDGIGTLTLNDDGTYTFVPDPDFIGTVPVKYTVTNDEGDSDTATLYLTTLPVNIQAVDDINQTPQDIPVDGNVLDNDKGEDVTVKEITVNGSGNTPVTVPVPETGKTSPVDIYDVDGTTKVGTIEIDKDGNYTFTPAEDYTGKVPVDYIAQDKYGNEDDATLTITVIPEMNPVLNNPPIANPDNGTVQKGETITINPLSNDSDPDNDDIKVTEIKYGETVLTGTPQSIVVDGKTAGTAHVDGDGNLVFTAADDFVGKVPPFDYTITDIRTDVTQQLTDSSTITITVTSTPTSPIVANDDANSGPKGEVQTGDVSENDNWGDPLKNPKVTDASVTIGDNTYTATDDGGNLKITIPDVGVVVIEPNGEYTFTPEEDFIGTVPVKYTVKNDDGEQDSATLYLTTIPENNKNYWIGGTSGSENDWNVPENWTANYVPTAYEDIEFATEDNNGVNGDGNGEGAAKADLYLDDVKHFDKDGNETEGRIIGDLINKSDKDLVITTTNQLIIDGKVHGDNMGIIVVKADENDATGTLIFNNPNENENKNVAAKVEFINLADECADCGFYKRNWQYFGIPVDGGAFPFNNPLLDGEMVRRWDEPTNGDKWLPVATESMIPFRGYEITSKVTAPKYEFEGTLNVGDKNIVLSKTPGVNYSGMNLLANSYTAAIPIELAAIELGSSLAENTVYLFNRGTRDQWRKTNGGSVPGTAGGQYTAVPVELAGQATLPDRILSMHSFMVNAASDGTQITLKYDQLVKNEAGAGQPAWRSADNNGKRQLPYIVLDVIGEGSADRVWLFEESSTTRGYDNGWDGHKMLEGDLIQVFATDADQNKYQVTTVPQFDDITVGIAARENESYTISVSTAADVENRRLYLHDTFTGRGYLLKDGAEIIIPGTRSANQNRFKITASNLPAAMTEASTINTYVRDNVIVVENRSGENATVSVYDISGRFVGKAQIAKDEMKSFPELSIAAGVKVVKVVSDSGAVNCSDRVLLK